MDESQPLEALSDVLTRISENPYDLSLHAQHVKLAEASGLDDQVAVARQMLTAYWPAGDEVWLPMIQARLQQGVDSFEGTLEVLAMFDLAEEDYLSIPMLQKHLEFLLDRHAYFNSLDSKPEEFSEVLSLDWTLTKLESIVQKGAGHPTRGHLLWDAQFNWAMEQLENTELQGEERTYFIPKVEDILLARLKQPHSTHEETFQFYSTFTTRFKPQNIYEKLLVNASKEKATAVKAYEGREQLEQFLAQSDYSPEAYDYYLTYERRAKKTDLPMTSMLYERAISDTAKRRFDGAENAEAALRSFWLGYCDVLRRNNESIDHQRAILNRAVRSIPGSGAIWARYIRFLESTESDADTLLQSVSERYDRALSTGLVQKDSEEIVPLVLARAGLIKRVIMTEDEVEGSVETLFKVLEDGITMVREASSQGDTRFRLEKFLADLYINLAGSPDLASTVWEITAKHLKSSYLAWTQYIESLMRQEKYDEARAVFRDVVTKRLDWPESIFDAWIGFEHLHGTLEDIFECLDKVEREQVRVNSRRAKEAEKAALHASNLTNEASTLITEAVRRAPEQANAPTGATSSMDVDDEFSDMAKKRKSEASEDKPDHNKKAKIGAPVPLKRDRENCTVFVADLPSKVSEDDLIALFKDCGNIREVKLSSLANSHVATVEFMERESVPAALTKDKKRISGQEITVHLGWQSTLYVTNFPEKVDDAYIRDLFGQFGLIFDVRWPSKKFKMTRRFCYVQFTSMDAARAALSLHGKELEPGLAMDVFVSDPERKKARSDANANDREVYVAGLSKFATKDDLEKLFKTYGPVKDIRMMKNDSGLSKGIAFVEFEDELSAQRALQANNYDLKNRRIAVTLSDARVRARYKNEQTASGLGRRSDIRSRSIRIKGLPASAQEGLLQQALEKVVTVKHVEIFQDSQEATAELESAADVGKLLLLSDPLKFGESILQISEELPDGASKRGSQPKAGGSMFIPRNAASRPRAGLGSSRKPAQNPSGTSEGTGRKPTIESGKRQNDFRKLLG